ncbi:MAG: class I SAM-dependent methyltransferase [Promethearchaeota archaeon]
MVKNFKKLSKRKKIINSYNSSAHFYDKRYKSIQREKYLTALNNCDLNQKKILDVGSGSGLLLETILSYRDDQVLLDCIYVAVDISWKMLLNFKQKSLETGKKMNPMLILSDIENLPFRNNIFDSVFSFTSFQNLSNLNKGIKESFRVSSSKAEFKFSILRKKLDLKNLLELLKPITEDLVVIDNQHLEDVVIKGRIS